MSMPLPDQKKSYTYDDYLSWSEEERWELIDGVPYCMSPAPSTAHQRVTIKLILQIGNFLEKKKINCELFSAPFDVRLDEEENEDDGEALTVVQPDILLVCDQSKVDDRGVKGAPDFIAEVASPSTAGRDQIKKRSLYEKCGVREYWIVDPLNKLIAVYLMDENNKYAFPKIYEFKDEVPLNRLPGLTVKLAEDEE